LLQRGIVQLSEASSIAQFDPPSREAWMALVEKTLKGGPLERLTSKTRDGLAIAPLYREGPVSTVRKSPGDPARPWDLRTRLAHPDPAQANADALTDLEGGAASLLVEVDPAGERGVAIASAADLERTLQGVLLELAPVALDAGLLAPQAADWLGALGKNAPACAFSFHFDPLSVLARDGRTPGPVESHVIAAATTGIRLARSYPKASLFRASGRVVHEAGGTEAQELAFALAATLAYAKAMVRQGAAMDEAFGRITLSLIADADYFTTIAKLRAARLLWAKLGGACGIEAAATIEARSSQRMLAKLDPWTNLLRLTSAGFGSAVGGADAIVLGAYTDAIGLPTAFARRQARNTQLVLMEEANLGRVADPAGGAWFLESLTEDLARAAWARFQAIEAAGGIVAALASGLIASEVAEAAKTQAAAIAKRRQGLVGVSEFPDLAEKPVEVESRKPAADAKAAPRIDKPGPDSACPPLTPSRLSEPFERLRAAAASAAAKPKVYLATLGGPSDYSARVTFAQNLFATGGIEPHVGSAQTYRGTKKLVVLCSSDARYAEEAIAAARALKAGGAAHLYLAGRPGDLEAALREAGVDEFIFAGQDVIEVLTRALEAA
jgi:methylmalonyl-CoA mutase